MRLIDADAIPYTEYDVSYGDGMYDTANGVYESEIDAMPTIDAIPIEWIENILAEIGNDSPFRPAIEWLLITYRMERGEE